MDLRASYGFFEWHSHVYYDQDLIALLTLIEFVNDSDGVEDASDRELRQRATMVLDLLLFDLALHSYRGSFGVTCGRTYKKDKMRSQDQDSYNLIKLLFGATPGPYSSHTDIASGTCNTAAAFMVSKK